MKKIKLKEKEYNIPQSWEDVNIKTFQNIYSLNKDKDEDEIKNNISKQFDTLSMYTGIPITELKQGTIKEVSGIANTLKFITEDIEGKQIVKFTHNDVEYNVMQGLAKGQFQDYVSIENVLQHSDRISMLHYILAIVSRKSEEETLDDYDVDERAEEFLNLDMVTAHNVSLFFSQLEKIYNINGIISSNPQAIIKEKSKEVQMNFSKLRVGKGWFTRSVIGIFRRLTIYLENRAMKYFQSSPQEQLKQTLSTESRFIKIIKRVFKLNKKQ